MRLSFSRPVRLTCLVIVSTVAGFSQGGFGTISGRITDAAGGVVPGATVQATNPETGLNASGKTDGSGTYQLLQLPPADYDLRVEAQGFKKLERKGIKVQVADRITLDLAVEVGAASESVTVVGEATALRTQDAQTGEVVTRTLIRDLPQLQRDPLRLLTVAGNIQGDGSRAEPGSDTRINGGRTIGVEYIIDGVSASTGLGHNVIRTTPTMETVGEFKVITNGISAEYGRLSGGAVELVTRGGTNAFHGEGFEYLQNSVLNANTWQQNTLGGKKIQFTQNIFGGVFGGPVWVPKVYNGHNKTFFLFNYQGTRRRQGGALQTLSVPTAMERTGDFSQTFYNGVSPVLYDQNGPVVYDSATNTYTRTQLIGDGKHIPASAISPVAAAILKLVPLPNQAPQARTSSAGNYVQPQSSRSDADLIALRMDHQFNDNHRFFGRFTTQDSASGSTRVGGPTFTANQTAINGALGLTLNYDWTKSSTFLINMRAGVNHNPFTSGNLLPADYSSADIPFDSVTRSLLGTKNLPSIGISGLSNVTSSQTVAVTNSTTYDFGLTATKILGSHTVKFGVQHRRYFDNFFNSGSGAFSFIAEPVHQIAGVDFGYGSDISNAYGLAAFEIGVNDRANATGDVTRANSFNYYAAFVQDDYKVSSRLTVNLGLRWDMETPVTERHDKIYFWDGNAAPPFALNPGYSFAGAVQAAGLDPATVKTPSWVTNGFPKGAIGVAGTPQYQGRGATFYHPNQFAPRLGFAYQLNSKTVVRGSYGLIYNSTSGAAGAFSTGGEGIRLANGADAGWHASHDNLVHLVSNFANPYSPGDVSNYERTVKAANLQGTSATGPSAFNRNSHMPHEHDLSLGIQRQLPADFLVEFTYNGNLGRGLLGPDLASHFPAELFNGGPAGTNARTYTTPVASPTGGQTLANSVNGLTQNLAYLEYAYPYFAAMAIQGTNIGTSNYHAANLRLSHRSRYGLFFLFNYTFSKLLDDVGGPNLGNGSGVNGQPLGAKRNQTVDPVTAIYGISTLDEAHVIRFTYNYELPVGRGKKWLSRPNSFGSNLVDYAIGGWQLAGLGSYRSGRPVVLQGATPNINNNIRAEWTYGNYLSSDLNILNSAFTDKSQVFYSSRDPRPANIVRAFTNVGDAKLFTYGTLPPVFPNVRQPSRTQYDMSLMKAFPFTTDGNKYIQFRLEGSNIFNIRGWGNYNTSIGTNDFGLITSAGPYGPRTIQVSGRFVF